MLADAYPAMIRKRPEARTGDRLMDAAEAGCFYHPGKKAVTPCAACGRFLCALCDVELNGDHICPRCLETAKKKKTTSRLENRRTLYDNVALYMAVLPALFIFPTLLTAPAALFVAIRYWNAPSSVVPRTRFRYYLAVTLAGGQLIGWSMMFYRMAT